MTSSARRYLRRRRRVLYGRLLQQPREPAVLEDPALRLAMRAVRHHVVLIEDRLEDRLAARARLALVRGHARRLRELLRQRELDLVLVDVDHAPELGHHRLAQRLRLALGEVVAALERRQL